MKKFLAMLTLSVCFMCTGVILLAQSSPTPAPVAAAAASAVIGSPAVVSSNFLVQTGGLIGAVSFIVFGLFTLLSAIRMVVAKYDGVAPGSNTPAPDAKLTFLNTALIWLGKAMDMVMGNVQH